jgi:hypothetical protein
MLILIMSLLTNACASRSVEGPARTSPPGDVWKMTAMTPGMRIEARTNNGKVIIVAGQGTERTFIFEHAGVRIEETIRLSKRQVEWDGITGIYWGGSYTPDWSTDDDPLRMIVQDGQVHRADQEECIAWMNAQQNDLAPTPWVYTSDGLAVSFDASPDHIRVAITIVQFYVNGEKPKMLRGAQDQAIRVIR